MKYNEFLSIYNIQYKYNNDPYFKESFDIIFNDDNLLTEATLFKKLQYITKELIPLVNKNITKDVIDYIKTHKEVLNANKSNPRIWELYNSLFWERGGELLLRRNLDNLGFEQRTDALAKLIELSKLIHYPINKKIKNIVHPKDDTPSGLIVNHGETLSTKSDTSKLMPQSKSNETLPLKLARNRKPTQRIKLD